MWVKRQRIKIRIVNASKRDINISKPIIIKTSRVIPNLPEYAPAGSLRIWLPRLSQNTTNWENGKIWELIFT